MKTITIIVERASDGTFGAYSNEAPIFAMGDTMQELKQSVDDAIDSIIEYTPEDAKVFREEYEIKYKFDTESLLQYYKGILGNPALEKLTGINQKQIHHYATGLKKPRKEQRQKIQEGLHKLGNELLAIEL